MAKKETVTAKQAYEAKRQKVEQLLVEVHAVMSASYKIKEPHWGHVGDMSRLEEMLNRALNKGE